MEKVLGDSTFSLLILEGTAYLPVAGFELTFLLVPRIFSCLSYPLGYSTFKV